MHSHDRDPGRADLERRHRPADGPDPAFAGSVWPPRLSQPAWAELLFLALGSTVAGMLLWNQAIVRGGSARISRLLYLEPVVSVLGAMVFLGERATAAVLIGGVLVLGGVLIAAAGPRRSAGRRPGPVRGR
jgi:drug/metabolite transporter (DMT)-like permease